MIFWSSSVLKVLVHLFLFLENVMPLEKCQYYMQSSLVVNTIEILPIPNMSMWVSFDLTLNKQLNIFNEDELGSAIQQVNDVSFSFSKKWNFLEILWTLSFLGYMIMLSVCCKLSLLVKSATPNWWKKAMPMCVWYCRYQSRSYICSSRWQHKVLTGKVQKQFHSGNEKIDLNHFYNMLRDISTDH